MNKHKIRPSASFVACMLVVIAMTAQCAVAVSVDAAKRAASDAVAAGKAVDDGVIWYAVDPLSNIRRNPDVYPEDGTCCGPLQVIAAKKEFESASFQLLAFSDYSDAEIVVSDLKGKHGVIPSSAVDVKVVKVWVQTGNAWHSYFRDPAGRSLTPELLLFDEDLVRVDVEKMENYLRINRGGGTNIYRWISAPPGVDAPFNMHRNDVFDAPALQPFSLAKGEFKQFWVTVEAPAKAEGLYSGTITVRVGGKRLASVPLVVNVLPFELPDPMTNYDLTRRYYASSYCDGDLSRYLMYNGNDVQKAEKRFKNVYNDYRKHNLMYPHLRTSGKVKELPLQKRQLELYRDAGLGTDTLFNAVLSHDRKFVIDYRNGKISNATPPEAWCKLVDAQIAAVKETLGLLPDIYCFGWDEPGMSTLRAERSSWEYIHSKGLKTIGTSRAIHLLHGGYNEDFVNNAGLVKRAEAAKWHAFGARITCYADPHTGPENPAFSRRAHGLQLYLQDADGTMNYETDVYNDNWNDFNAKDPNMRGLVMVYALTDGHVGTLQFEGFREAIDDVRYATLLKQLATKAAEATDPAIRYPGKTALQWLALVNGDTCDLNVVRLEMITHILKLRNVLR